MHLVARQGFQDTTVEEITQAADVGKGTFFNYFPSKEELFNAFGEIRLGKVRSALEAAQQGREPIATILRRLELTLAEDPGRSGELARSIILTLLSSETVRTHGCARLKQAQVMLHSNFDSRTKARRGSSRRCGRRPGPLLQRIAFRRAFSVGARTFEQPGVGDQSLVRALLGFGSGATARPRKERCSQMIGKRSLLFVILLLLGATPAFGQTNTSPSNGLNPPSPYTGSVAHGTATQEVLKIGFADAIERGLKYNLGLLLAEQDITSARGERWKQLSDALPNLTTNTTETAEKVNLLQNGFNKIRVPNSPFAGINPIAGPFGFFDTRAYVSTPILDWSAIQKVRSASESLRASRSSYKSARELVVLTVGYNYLLAISYASRIETADAQLKTAEALYNQASDRLTRRNFAADRRSARKSGISNSPPAIDSRTQ